MVRPTTGRVADAYTSIRVSAALRDEINEFAARLTGQARERVSAVGALALLFAQQGRGIASPPELVNPVDALAVLNEMRVKRQSAAEGVPESQGG